jgi:hypothetical protein
VPLQILQLPDPIQGFEKKKRDSNCITTKEQLYSFQLALEAFEVAEMRLNG